MIEKKYLTIDELAERWSCSKKDIHYLIGEGELAPSIAWDGLAIICQWEPHPEDQERLILCDVNVNGCSSEVHLTGWMYLRLPQVTGASEYRFWHASYDEFPNNNIFSPGSLYRLAKKNEWCTSSASVDYQDIERYAVFMLSEVSGVELILRPSIGLAMEKRLRPDRESEQIVSSMPSQNDDFPPSITNHLAKINGTREVANNVISPWHIRARAIGSEIKQKLPRLNQMQIAEKVRSKLIEENLPGRGKKFPSAETIKREALKGI